MESSTLIVVNAASTPEARRLIGRVHACWDATRRPSFEILESTASLGDRPEVGVAAVWLLAPTGPMSDDLGVLIRRLVDHHIPVLLTRWNHDEVAGATGREGAVMAPADAGPSAISTALQTLWSLHVTVEDLRSEVELLRAHQGGLTERIEHIDEELRLAAQLQRGFLPTKLPRLPNLAVDVLYRPAGYVSGDIYDVIRVDEHHVGFFMADAVGHGVSAALMTIYIKQSLRTKRIDSTFPLGYEIISPADAMGRLNRDICRQKIEKTRLATACYGLLDTRTMRLAFSRAGHPYPLLLHEDGSMETIEPEGAMLGIFEEEQYETTEVQLAAGDRFVLYTDGFEVAFPEGRGERGNASRAYLDVFRKLAEARTTGEAMSWLARTLDGQVGSLNQCDDLTAMLLAVDGLNGAEETAGTAFSSVADVTACPPPSERPARVIV